MNFIFHETISLIDLDLSSFNNNNIIYMVNIFDNCSSLVKLNISNFNISPDKYFDMQNIFSGCNSLKEIKCSEQLKMKIPIQPRPETAYPAWNFAKYLPRIKKLM